MYITEWLFCWHVAFEDDAQNRGEKHCFEENNLLIHSAAYIILVQFLTVIPK